ncbi:relaxase/mobilization nuclease domain-containing protein [Fibrivirga algicola]|uniref:Relaxase/mobilization nuclease domain-containing protein n=1 Tax=Fibrivirga algicola TaxID=2950420 RepID=A0ABX0QLN5_9BACT|nr:relaxase/mobilization nuclease domain-containing protein [Fibrivirga algicola]NID13406.1 relaxase/mobilization nuclease domain-containing protein [Fibrivirga algicola]
MVIRILTGKDVAGALRYNEQKVEQGEAERIQIANYPDNEKAQKYARFRLQLLEQYARLNPGIQKPSVHLAVAFHPKEVVGVDQLQTIGGEVMREIGFGKQPYLMYQHHDTKHPHIHVVSVAVDAEGRKITDKFIKNRLQRVRRRLETKYGLVQAERPLPTKVPGRVGEELGIEQQSTRLTVDDKVKRTLETYSFGSVNSLKQYLSCEGIVMNTKAGRSQTGITYQHVNPGGADNRPIKASSLPSRPTHANLTELFSNRENQHKKECNALESLIEKRLALYRSLTETEFKQTLRQLGIETREANGAYLYISKQTRAVIHEAELEKPFSREVLVKGFSEKRERKPVEKSKPVIQSSHDAAVQKQKLVDTRETGAYKREATRYTESTIVQSYNKVVDEKTEKQTKGSVVPDQTGGLPEKPAGEEHVPGRVNKKQKKNQLRKWRRY